MSRRVFRQSQKDMARYTTRVRHPKLFVEMRLGKTLVPIRVIRASVSRTGNNLVVCPYSAVDAWRKELTAEGVPFTEIFGTIPKDKRATVLNGLSGWVITNKEIWRTIPNIRKMDWDNRIIDESTCLRNPFSKITRYFTEENWSIDRDWRLTGTPDPDSRLNFYGQTKDIWKEQTYYEWRGKWFVPFNNNWDVKPRLKDAFHAVLAEHCFFLSRKDAGVGGEKIRQTRLVRFSSEMKKIYNQVAKEFLLTIPSGEKWETTFAGVKYSWLRRLAGGALPDSTGKLSQGWNGKTDELLYLLHGDLCRDQVVIWAHFTEEVERIAKLLDVPFIHGDVSPTKRTETKTAFEKNKVQWLVAQPACLAHSTDFAFCDTAIYYSSPSSTEIRHQSEDRLISVAKKTPNLIIDLVTEGSVDEIIVASDVEKWSRTETERRIIQCLQKQIT